MCGSRPLRRSEPRRPLLAQRDSPPVRRWIAASAAARYRRRLPFGHERIPLRVNQDRGHEVIGGSPRFLTLVIEGQRTGDLITCLTRF